MPRSAPGANRGDLLVPGGNGAPPGTPGQPNGQPTQPIATPTGLPYGEAGALQAQQAAAPLPASQPTPPTQGNAPGSGGPNPGPSQPLDIAGALQAAKNFEMPNLGNFERPTERPNEHVMAGTPGGPRPAVGNAVPQQNSGISSMLARMSMAAQNPALAMLAQAAQAQGK